MNDKPLKVLLVEDDLEDIALFEEALVEIEESLYRREWMRRCEFIPADRVSEALDLLRRETFDVILLDTSLPDGSALDSFLRVQRAAPEIPIVVLSATDDEPLAISLVRQGAQDYLLKPELDCAPLARALRCAIERHRVRKALGALTFLDDLTGLYSWGGFLNLADRCLTIAASCGRHARLFLIDAGPSGSNPASPLDREPDVTCIRTADWLRGACHGTDIIGRRGAARFAVLAIEDGSPRLLRLERLLERGPALTQDECSRVIDTNLGVASTDGDTGRSIETLVELAEAALCENGRSKAKAAN
jgi:CheY-like chemotaxis protein